MALGVGGRVLDGVEPRADIGVGEEVLGKGEGKFRTFFLFAAN